MSARVGLFGGTFDPIHNAHLRMAEAAAARCDLSRVLLIPASAPPHRTQGPYASYEDRFRMVQIACQDHPALEASRLDEGPGKSYTIHTVERFLDENPASRDTYFVIGADAFAELPAWYRWQDLVRLVTFAVVGRPGALYHVPEVARIVRVDGVDSPVSSSEIRNRISAKYDLVEVAPQVLEYIREHQLYS